MSQHGSEQLLLLVLLRGVGLGTTVEGGATVGGAVVGITGGGDIKNFFIKLQISQMQMIAKIRLNSEQ